MNCRTITRTDTSSLFKNGRLIAQASSTFSVRKCYDINLKISSNCYCCLNRRMVRVLFSTTNIGSDNITNAILRTIITPRCCNCNCTFNSMTKIFYINNLAPGCIDNIWINLPYPCNRGYIITGQVIVNNVLLKEDTIRI